MDAQDFIESYFYKKEPLTQTCHFPLTIDGLFCPFFLIIVPGFDTAGHPWAYDQLDSYYFLYIKSPHQREIYLDLQGLIRDDNLIIVQNTGCRIVHIKYTVSPDDFIDSLNKIYFLPPYANNYKNQLITSANYEEYYFKISPEANAVTSERMKISPYALSNELFNIFYSYN